MATQVVRRMHTRDHAPSCGWSLIVGFAIAVVLAACADTPAYGGSCSRADNPNTCSDQFNLEFCHGDVWNSTNCITVCGDPDAACGYDPLAGEDRCLCNSSPGAGDDSYDPSAGGDACSAAGDICEANGECCGYFSGDAYCVSDGGAYGECMESCFDDNDCTSGCCIPLEGGDGACAPSYECG